MRRLRLCGRYSEQKSGALWKIAPFSPDGCAWTALLLCCCAYHLLPSVLCDTDWRRQPYNSYNVSNFQNQHSPYPQPYQQRRLYTPPYHHVPQSYEYFNNLVQRKRRVLSYDGGGNNGVNDFGNNIIGEDYDVPLLVAYSHNPYADSVKSVDFEKEAIARTTERWPQSPRQEARGKRGVLHLYNMISCATSCDPISYKGYGCYCGFLGSGTALDGIDSCCRSHDQCYERLFCPFFTVYLQPYFWRCHRGHPVCALENLNTRNQFVHGCAAQLCECDRRLAMCLRRYSCPRRPAICTSSPLRLLQNLIMIR